MARIYLYSNDYSNAAQHASLGLQDGDAPFYARPGLEDPWPNWYWYEAGNNRTRYTLASRFKHMLIMSGLKPRKYIFFIFFFFT